ncbi:methionine--tRNA ligase [Tuwongella immobilis]|uniref:methionine--tRNA ligase n=1 Tax=Tuwongella immobilis TaxID=692036 RepID=A0A6C2YJI6_9BACT|nr:methionine--tRNA ligase [Tuwongella immobilis]VIP01399.1 methionyl-trna synthetase : Methionine--tRNA ligase OS=Singulisphaera acidiphila (strain ATCC BAA-1392 / DSM 18658 / VKM B-2454 / MOB10) GN=metG PE=3 SV=1: tRNA-synt_1g [Tuwongella immobilis]VTR98290.1 methionyl-trna synthetase : Methionine--tRNA ligase OS=Singulisphaera acidiphila (strain ATCC BAA-1392 / DSM 18658 / VKM B-2454 / MOB10) GN=metG PE=3 SV=1: tRNA-synt_1g [Tuwongella immobilis]
MSEKPRFYLTTAIDYPNSRPHIGTAFEKLGADVQARYRRMEGANVFFLMGNDENTIKVAKRAAELGLEPKPYCDDMARQFKEVWTMLNISFDDFIQTSEERHHIGCRKFIQKVYDNGYIRKGSYEGWYCEGCEAFKTEKELVEGKCPDHKMPAIRRTEPCFSFELSKFQAQLLAFYEANPDFIQPESRRNEILALVKEELRDVNITRVGQTWGIRVPFDETFTIYVWFDALLNYITGVGYGTDEERFAKWWPADIHFIGKDITRFHCALWPAMCFAAGITPPKLVFGHGFVNNDGQKMSKSLGNIVEPGEILSKFGVTSDAVRYYFMRECPFPSDGDYSEKRFVEVFNSELANTYGNLYSRIVTLVTGNYAGTFAGTAGQTADAIPGLDIPKIVANVREAVEQCRYSQALQAVMVDLLMPVNQFMEANAPWKLVKTDLPAAAKVLFTALEPLRVATILLKPFIPLGAETIYRGFNFDTPWESVSYADAARPGRWESDLRVTAELNEKGKVTPVYQRLNVKTT